MSTQRRRIIPCLVILMFLAFPLFFASAEEGVTDNEIVIGTIQALTGDMAFIGNQNVNGTKIMINEINKNRNNNTNHLSKAPTSPDILAIVPVKISGVNTGSLLVEFSGSLQDNIRTYFGPVDIDRMAVKLLDDKGNILNLNGADWCTTFICECLYQY